MGDRSNIKVRYSTGDDVYLYGHWMGKDNREIVEQAMADGRRVTDESYFTRILFSRMIEDDVHGETGFGIAPYPVDQDFGNPTIVVDYRRAQRGIPEIYEEE